ncbi:MAG: hypothetical protein IPP08_03365 [Chlorobiota bacterium]|nr:hypothetical protein [Chlorobiota bacterium]QQS67224.1 MAG: hypothetical protein IPP08_03365 [Chlorobiota bacterium]
MFRPRFPSPPVVGMLQSVSKHNPSTQSLTGTPTRQLSLPPVLSTFQIYGLGPGKSPPSCPWLVPSSVVNVITITQIFSMVDKLNALRHFH